MSPENPLTLLAVFIVAFANLSLGLIVLLKNRFNLTNASFSIFTFVLAAWLVCGYFSINYTLSHDALLWLNRITFLLPGIGLYFLLLFSVEFTRFGYSFFKPFTVAFGPFALLFSVLSASPLLIANVAPASNIVLIDFGPLTYFFVAFVTVIFLMIIANLGGSIPYLSGSARARTKIMTASLFLALGITVGTNFILPALFSNFAYILPGLLSTIIIVGGFSYAIIHHRLFDIRAVVAKSITYVLLLALLGGTYAFITFQVGGALFQSNNIVPSQQLFNVAIALVLALTFQPLKRLLEVFTDNIFYRSRYDPEALMKKVSNVLASEIELAELTRKVNALLLGNLHAAHVDIAVAENSAQYLGTGRFTAEQLHTITQKLKDFPGQLVIADEQPEGGLKDLLHGYGISVLAVLRTGEGKVGYLLFGEKLSGDIYTNLDLKVISTVADQLAVAIENAKSYAEIQRFNHTLQSKIAAATLQLRDANTNLQQLDKVKDEFISMASHQLRTPLTVIDGYLSNILSGIYGTFNNKQDHALTVVRNQVRLTSGLVADLLNLSRMEVGRFFLDTAPVELGKVVAEEVEQLKIKAEQQKTSLVYTPPTHPVATLVIDEQKTRQVIMNLIDNAINYTPHGTVRVTLETEGNQVVFKVSDNGIGVPEEAQGQLFNKFFRAKNAQDVRADGTGIGLYLVKRVVEQQGGTIIFNSRVGMGSTFGFQLPFSTFAKTHGAEPPHSTASEKPNVAVALAASDSNMPN